MKNLIKGIIPKRMMPIAQKVHHRLFEPKSNFSQKRYRALTALKCNISYNQYGGYCVPESSSHRPAAQKIISNDVYEPKTIKFIMSNCGNGDVVHAGTYFGDFLPALSKGAAPGSKVWAFEPNSENYRCAKITLEINAIENVVLTNAGLGARQGDSLMQTADGNGRALGGASHVIDTVSEKVSGVENIQIVTVDDMIGLDRTVSIIQLDVEGHEKDALNGALMTIQRCLPIIILEVWSRSTLLDSDWFYENILSHGYRKVNEIHGNSVFQCESELACLTK